MRIKSKTDYVIHYQEVLEQYQLESLLQLVKDNIEQFTDTGTLGENAILKFKARKSLELKNKLTRPFKQILIERLTAAFLDICAHFDIEPFEINQFETHLTAHNDGDYYLWHTDNKSERVRDRIITYVFYFNMEPKQFSGGELGIYPENAEPIYITPENNTMVIFKSSLLHEVKPVSCPSRIFENGRFTLNGWIKIKSQLPKG